jgi:hypothetical protein
MPYRTFNHDCSWNPILDYKPGASKEKPITQLYALALSRRTGLRLYDLAQNQHLNHEPQSSYNRLLCKAL